MMIGRPPLLSQRGVIPFLYTVMQIAVQKMYFWQQAQEFYNRFDGVAEIQKYNETAHVYEMILPPYSSFNERGENWDWKTFAAA